MRRAALLVVAMAVILGGITGCETFDHVDLCVVTQPVGSHVGAARITLRKGEVIALKGIPFATDNGVMDDDTEVYMESGDEAVLGLAPLDYEGDECGEPDHARWYYLIWGVEVGQTTLVIYGAGQLSHEVEVEVTP